MLLASLRIARAPLAAFAAMGVLWGGFAADMPDLKAMLGVDEAQLGRLLLATPLAAILAMFAAPALARGLGRHVLAALTLAMAAAFALPGQAGVWWLFPLAMLAAGASTGAVDVLMNARATMAEARAGRPLMNLCHAAYSFGYAGGALMTGALRAQSLPPGVVMGALALTAGLIALATIEADGRIEGLARPPRGQAPGLGLVPLIGGGVVLIAFLTENAAEYWSALHVEQTLGGSPAFGSAAPAVLALTMGLARLAGQGLSHRISALRLLLGAAALAACGALLVAAAPGPSLAYLGFIVLGLGASVISPTAFTLIGQAARPEARARAVARATMLGYCGYFIGPPALGLIAGHFGLRAAFLFAAAMLLLVWALAPLLSRRA
jgi:Major Facilitator Superfamily